MFFEGIAIIPVVIATVISMALGFVWYSPYIFGKQWLSLMGDKAGQVMETNQSKSKMAKIYAIATLSSLVSAYILAVIFNSIIAIGFSGILTVGFSLWLGFMLPILLNNVLYGGEPVNLFLINAGYQLVSITLMTLIIGIFG